MCIRDSLYTKEILQNAFDDFEIKLIETYDEELEEGAGHKGMSALIDMVAQKPVSYTHLDVYKRQVRRPNAFKRFMEKFKFGKSKIRLHKNNKRSKICLLYTSRCV